MKKLGILLIFLSLAITGCNNKKHYKEKVSSYQIHQQDENGNDLLLYYLVFSSMNNSNYYYYFSNTQINSSNYSSIKWNESSINPINSLSQDDVTKLEDKEINMEEFPEEIQTQMEENPENFEGMIQEEMGDYEGTSTSSASAVSTGDEDNGEPSSESSSESSGESGDSGGGDSGGGE